MGIRELGQYLKELKAKHPELRIQLQEVWEDALDAIHGEGANEHHECELAYQSMKDIVSEEK